MARKTKAVKERAQKFSPLKNKISVSWKSFIVFLVLFLVSFPLYILSSTPLFENLFQLLSIIFGFLSLALLIVLIVFLILKSGRR